jgi:hypothetical protein
MFPTEFIDLFMIHVQIKLHTASFKGSLAISIKRKLGQHVVPLNTTKIILIKPAYFSTLFIYTTFQNPTSICAIVTPHHRYSRNQNAEIVNVRKL